MNENPHIHAFRLKPGQDLKIAIQEYVKSNNILAGWIITGVGSLTLYHLRFANQVRGSTGSGFFEIVSLSGTVSIHGCHLHLAISDGKGVMIGGHLLEASIIYTTAEIVIGESRDLVFARKKDSSTGFEELDILGSE